MSRVIIGHRFAFLMSLSMAECLPARDINGGGSWILQYLNYAWTRIIIMRPAIQLIRDIPCSSPLARSTSTTIVCQVQSPCRRETHWKIKKEVGSSKRSLRGEY